MRVLDDDDFQLIRDAWELISEMKPDIYVMLDQKAKANGRYGANQLDYIQEIGPRSITFAQIDGHDDGEWDVTLSDIEFEDLRDIDGATQRYRMVAAVIEETRVQESAERIAKQRRDQYEKLKAEFEKEGQDGSTSSTPGI